MDRLQKMANEDSSLFIIGIILLGISIFLIIWGFNLYNSKDLSDFTNFYDVENVGTKAYIEVISTPYIVAETEDQANVYALVYDENNYMYLIQSKTKNLKKIYENSNEKSIILKGIAYKTESNIIGFTIDGYNEYVDEEIIDENNYTSYLGEYYLDLDASYSEGVVQIFFGFIILICGLSFTISGLISKQVTKKTISSEYYPLAEQEINNPELEINRTIFTNNFIIYNKTGLRIINYKDITWIYCNTFVYNGVPNHSFAYYVKGDKNVKMIFFGIKQEKVNEMIKYVYNKNPNILVGFTKENKDANKNMN